MSDNVLPAAIVAGAATVATGMAVAAYFVGKGMSRHGRGHGHRGSHNDRGKERRDSTFEDSWADRDREMRGRANSEAQFAQVPHKTYTVAPSMEDIVLDREKQSQKLAKLSPQEVLTGLQEGNARFWMGVAERPELNAMERRAMIMQQFPKVAILGCADSRVPVEIVFDQGLGDVFTIRVAGNCYAPGVAASLDYAVCHLHVKLIVVLGHEGCGAVRAAQSPAEQIAKEPAALKAALSEMAAELKEHAHLEEIKDMRARDREAVVTNVRHSVQQIYRGSTAVLEKVQAGSLAVVGAFYEISSGMVDFVDVEGACGICHT